VHAREGETETTRMKG